jgi:DMSO/TMAO reductase YedYZ heme-binding membrane subunit
LAPGAASIPLAGSAANPLLGARPSSGFPQPPASALPRPPSRNGPVYRGVPRPIRIAGWATLAIMVGAVVGTTAPTAILRILNVAAVQPGLLAWYTVRAMGFLAYLVLAASVIYGLLLSTKILDAIAHRPVSFALHKDLAIVGLIMATLHGAILIFDQSFNFTPSSLLVPFTSPYAPITVGIGQLTFYACAVVTGSFYVRRRIGQKVWRQIHYITFIAFVGASFHGIMSGSDSGSWWAFWIYLAPITAAVFLVTYRIVVGVANLSSEPKSELAGTPGALPVRRGPLDRPGATSGGL